ncbi:MAG: glycosyltransferase family 39 protein [Solirubrobacteraceae bacterium]
MPTAERRWAWPALGLILAGGLLLRLWGIRQGLPFVYNIDEADHFVPHAVKMFEAGTLDPHYFANPPAFTYLLHVLFAVSYGGAGGAEHALRTNPESVYTLARVAAALLGTLALWLLYLLGARLFSRAVGLLAAAVEAVAFLPVFYAHVAVNDAPTLAPLTLSLLGSAGVLRKGRLRDHLLAGIGLGLACATKYTAGIVALPYLAACAASYFAAPLGRRDRWAALGGVAVMVLAAAIAFVAANPYALLDFSRFHREVAHQSAQSAEAQGKLGAPRQGGLLYYLWALTWGLGWVPALAALAGAVAVWWRDRSAGWMLVPAPLLFLAFMGAQGRYFGRWLMPILPILCLLAAWAGAAALGLALRGRRGEPRDARFWVGLRDRSVLGAPPLALALVVVAALLAQGIVYSVHSGIVLARTDTRTLTRTWMLANVPRGAQVVVEPVSPDNWAREAPGQPGPPRCNGHQWCKYPSRLSRIDASGQIAPAAAHVVGIENYVRTLAPALLAYYTGHGYCWVVSGSTQAQRALVDPSAAPLAAAYYRALAQQGRVVYRASPYARGAGPVAFNFDWSFDYYPLAYSRPGPAMTVYRLSGGRCGA